MVMSQKGYSSRISPGNTVIDLKVVLKLDL